MFNIPNINNNRSAEYILNDFLNVVRTQNSTLNNIVNTMSSNNNNVVSVMHEWFELRRRILDLSNNIISRPRRRPRAVPPPPPPTQNTFRFPSNRSRRRSTFYTPMFPTTTTGNNTRNTITNFINNTLWDATNQTTPASINTILNNSSIHIWHEIKDQHQNTERCPIDLSLLNDNDIVVKLTHCNHVFKYINIFRWFAINSRCPVCRNNISDPTNTRDNSNNNIPIPQDTSSNDISSNNIENTPIASDISMNISETPIQLENIRRRVESLLNLDSSTNIITADITFETYIPPPPPPNN